MKMKGMICFSLCLLLVPSAWAASKVYKCKNAQGAISYQDVPCTQPTDSVSTWDAKKGSSGNITLNVGEGGHYFVDARVNGQNMQFVVDTGASFVAIPIAMGMAAQLTCQDASTANTAGGPTTGCSTTIGTLSFGPFTLSGVKAVLLPSLSQPLLGMNVLRQFNISQEGDRMRITAK